MSVKVRDSVFQQPESFPKILKAQKRRGGGVSSAWLEVTNER